MKIPHFITLKSVCHKIASVKGVGQMLTKGGGGVSQKVTKDGEGGGGGPGNPQNWLT